MAAWLDDYFRAWNFKVGGILQPKRATVNFTGVTATDDEANDTLRLTVGGDDPRLDGILDPRDYGCPWDGVGDDLPGLQALLASIPADRVRPVRVQLPPGQGYCSGDLHINRPVEIIGNGKAYAAFASAQHGLRFPPLKGIILHGYFSSPDYPGGRSDGSRLRDLNIVSTRAIVSDAVGNWGRAGYQLDTTQDVWANLPSTVPLGSVVLKSGATVGSPGGDYYGDGTTRNSTHLVMFRCTTAGTKGSAQPGAFATAGLAQIGTTISATGGTAVWTVESVPKDYANATAYVVGQRVFLPGDPDHVFECVTAGTSLSAGTLNFGAFGIGRRCPPGMVAPAYGLQFYDRTTGITAPSNGAALPQATINVDDTTDFAASGSVHIWTGSAWTTVSYTGKTGTTLTGCTGGTGTLTTAAEVGQGIEWKVIPSGGVTVLGNWVDQKDVAIFGATGAAVWITGNLRREASGAGGANFWSVRDGIFAFCGSGLTLNSNNANGGESKHCQETFLGAGHTNVDAAGYLALAPEKRYGNGACAVKDRCQGNNRHSDHYVQFSGGMPYRNDLFTGSVPGGNYASFSKLAAEVDFLPVFLSPATVESCVHGVSSRSTATVLDGNRSLNVRGEVPLVTDPTMSVTATLGPINSSAASPFQIRHETDAYDVGFSPTDDLLYYPTGWWTFGKTNVPGGYDSQAFLVTRPGAGGTWPGGTAIAGEAPFWINNSRVWIGEAPNQDPPSIGFGTSAPASGYYVRGSVVWNKSAAVGQPKGWQCTVTGSPGTWVSMGNL